MSSTHGPLPRRRRFGDLLRPGRARRALSAEVSRLEAESTETGAQLEVVSGELLILEEEHEELYRSWLEESEASLAASRRGDDLLRRLEVANSRLSPGLRVPAEGEPSALAEQQAFLEEMLAVYRERFSDHLARPLRPTQLGWDFLAAAARYGLPRRKLLEVCAEVASGRVFEMATREAHALRIGPGPHEPQRTRADSARAWRCSLKRNTPSAPRLHWWEVPGGSVELAFAGPHDDYSCPE